MKRASILSIACLTVSSFGLGGCGELAPGTKLTCDSPPPSCIAPNADDPCAESSVVAAACEDGSHEWRCPSGTRVYARAPDSASVCRPFQDAKNIGPWGLSSMTHIPTDDGRCLWIADSATLQDGTTARNVAFEPDPAAP